MKCEHHEGWEQFRMKLRIELFERYPCNIVMLLNVSIVCIWGTEWSDFWYPWKHQKIYVSKISHSSRFLIIVKFWYCCCCSSYRIFKDQRSFGLYKNFKMKFMNASKISLSASSKKSWMFQLLRNPTNFSPEPTINFFSTLGKYVIYSVKKSKAT